MANVSQRRKYWQPFLILVVLVIALWLMVVSMAVLIPFLVGILLAYILMPLVTWFEGILPPKGKALKAKRIVAVVLLFFVIILLLILFTAYIGSALVSASNILIVKAPDFLTMSANQVTTWVGNFKGSLPQTIALQIGPFIDNLGPAAGKFVQDFILGSIALIPASVPTIIGFMVMPFFLFFILMDYESFKKYFYDVLPPNAARHTGSVLSIIATAMGRYLRSQIILGLIAGTLVFLGLLALQIDYAPALAAVTALTQFIPIIGPVISGLIIVIITLALAPDKILWVLMVFIAVQVLLNTVFVNWIQGKYMQIHPAIVMVLLVVGGYVGGFWGMILALPVAATVWEIFKYIRSQQQAEIIEA
ncbi:MAG: AI-2E family transporter [Dehalococcoidia bacterium]